MSWNDISSNIPKNYWYYSYNLAGIWDTKLVGYDIDMWANHYGNVLLFLVASVLGIIATVCFSIVFNQNQIEAIGKDSLYYYGIHVIFVDIIVFLVNVIKANIGLIFPCWQILVTGISVLIVCFCVKKTLPLYKSVIDRLKRIYIRIITGNE